MVSFNAKFFNNFTAEIQYEPSFLFFSIIFPTLNNIMYNSHRLIAGRPWVAVIHKTSKTAPQSSPKTGKILEKSS